MGFLCATRWCVCICRSIRSDHHCMHDCRGGHAGATGARMTYADRLGATITACVGLGCLLLVMLDGRQLISGTRLRGEF